MQTGTDEPVFRATTTPKALALAVLVACTGLANAQPQYSDWGANVATGLGGGCPIESRSGNELFVAGGFEGSLDIFYYERAGNSDLLFRRNSTTGAVECLTNKSAIELNEELHAHN